MPREAQHGHRRLRSIPTFVGAVVLALLAPILGGEALVSLQLESMLRAGGCEEESIGPTSSRERKLSLAPKLGGRCHAVADPRTFGGNPRLSPPTGHCLPNGLRAPLVC